MKETHFKRLDSLFFLLHKVQKQKILIYHVKVYVWGDNDWMALVS